MKKRTKCHSAVSAALLILGFGINSLHAHTTSWGFENAGVGSIRVWSGTYHFTTTTEGSLLLTSSSGGTTTAPFTLVQNTKPTGLIDGVNNFYGSDHGALTLQPFNDTNSGDIETWQGAVISGISPGKYTFSYDPLSTFSFLWDPNDPTISGGSPLIISATDLGLPLHTVSAKKPVPIQFLVDDAAIASALFSSIPTALSQRELAFGGSRTTLRDFNSRLFRARAGRGISGNKKWAMKTESVEISDNSGKTPVGKSKQVVFDAVQPDAQRWELFTSFDYSNIDTNLDKNFQSLDAETYAESLGIEYMLTDHINIGLGASYLHSNTDGAGTDVDGATLATYASGSWGNAYVDLLYGATFLSHDIDRNTGLNSTAHASPDSVTHAVNLNTGYNLTLNNFTTGPIAGLDYAHANVDGYTETGGGSAATRVSEQSVDSLVTRLGWQISCRIAQKWGAITPQFRVAWERENISASEDLNVGLLQSPFYLKQGSNVRSAGGTFDATRKADSRQSDRLAVGAGVSVEMGSSFRLMLDYEANLLETDYKAHFAKIAVGWKF